MMELPRRDVIAQVYLMMELLQWDVMMFSIHDGTSSLECHDSHIMCHGGTPLPMGMS